MCVCALELPVGVLALCMRVCFVDSIGSVCVLVTSTYVCNCYPS